MMRLRSFFPVLLVVALLGCNRGPKLYPVTATLSMEGESVDQIQVILIPEDSTKPTSSTLPHTGGELTFVTGPDASAGAAEGNYKVVFRTMPVQPGAGGGGFGGGGGGGARPEAPAEGGEMPGAMPADPRETGEAPPQRPDEGGGSIPGMPDNPFPSEYSSPDTTPVTVTVEPTRNHFEWELPKK